jgi:signal recognition particle subunit SRP68
LEAEAYASFMTGNFHFHREEHEESLKNFTTARRIYMDLAKVGTTNSQKEIFQNCIEELEPFIRFSLHCLNHKKSNTEVDNVAWSTTEKEKQEEENTNTNTNTNGIEGASNALLQSKIDRVLFEARKQKVAAEEFKKKITWKEKEILLPTKEMTWLL